ncbi:hypothetical protein HOY82DRAFT_616256 [Tuber indicum]|nr:hypothetical protein HOY82DRAFT_616256 [Tuber indicum]
MVTHVVAEAWAAFTSQKSELLRKSFRDLGVTLPIDGSRDSEIHIKGFENIDVGNWMEDVPLPLPFQPLESHRSLPLETVHHDALEFVWTCENYIHPADENTPSAQPMEIQPTPPPGGTLLHF